VTPLDWLALWLVSGVVVGCGGIWLGRRLEREQTRMRGEHALDVYRDLAARDPWIFLTATERLIRKATGLPDVEPPTTGQDV
jgi:hypothetical protein